MHAAPLRVGIVGASPKPGSWARESHVPALTAAGLTLAGVATQSQRSADAAAAEFGADRGYGSPAALIAATDLDIIAVASPVPTHRAILLDALAAGRHVLSEWPLGTGTAEAEELATAARSAGVHAAVGLQGSMHPAVAAARAAIDAGRIGRILSARVLSTTAGFGPRLTEALLSLEDPATNMNLISIQAAHTVDLVEQLLGPFRDFFPQPSIRFPRLTVDGAAEAHRRVLPDHLFLLGRTDADVPVCVEVSGGHAPDDTPFRFEVRGESGQLTLEGGAARGFQAGQLSLRIDGTVQPLTSPAALVDLADSAVNVAHLYAALRDDIREDRTTAPTFDRAARLAHRVGEMLGNDEHAKP